MSPDARRWTVSTDAARMRLDQFLSRELPDQSRSRIQKWIRAGQVRVNGKAVKAGYALRSRDEIALSIEQVAPTEVQPEAIPLRVIHEDEDIVVLDKPAGLVVHAGAGVTSGTLVNALLYRYGRMTAGDPRRPGIVHRLDKGTSGVMVVARNDRAHRALASQFRCRQVVKEYLALVYGRPRAREGTIKFALGRDPRHRKKISVRAHKKREAITHYRIEKEYGELTLLLVRIETGRTHQIRVHLAHAGHPVVGDSVYGGQRWRNLRGPLAVRVAGLGRVFLHARRLEFRHPTTGAWVSFTSSLAPELESFLCGLAAPEPRAGGLTSFACGPYNPGESHGRGPRR